MSKRSGTRQPAPKEQEAGYPPNNGNGPIVSAQWSGPLPPPAALEHFNEIIPNGAERIMSMVEREQAHRIEHESTVLSATIRDHRRGHWIGGVLALACVAGAVYTADIGAHWSVSVALVSLPIAAVARQFISRHWDR